MLFSARRPVYDFLAIGDCVIDVFLTIEEATVTCEIKRDLCKLCLTYGEKVPLKSINRIIGAGNASNAAFGASRLGWKTGIHSIVGSDSNGEDIVRAWKDANIATDLVQVDKLHPTNYHTILHFLNERTILIYHQPRQYKLLTLPDTRWIYYSSLGKNHDRLESQLLSYLRSHPNTKLVFQPGTFQLRRGKKALMAAMAQTTIFAVNKQEAQRLLETKAETITELMKGLHSFGAKIAVITDGNSGSYASDGVKTWFCPIFPAKVVEVTGAGDSYTVGFTYGYHKTGSVMEAMRYGTANSWSVVQYVGPHKGLLTARQFQHVLKQFHKIQPSEYLDVAQKKTRRPSKRT